MRKKIIGDTPEFQTSAYEKWHDLEQIARVEVTSEAPSHPIESALIPGLETGWRAEQPGEQIIRLLFDAPQRIRQIHLEFEETERERTQEFVLRWSPDQGKTFREIVRQQYNLSAGGSSTEVEDYKVDLVGLTVLELKIVPHLGGGDAVASLRQFQVA